LLVIPVFTGEHDLSIGLWPRIPAN
jgi:hypothetical protein